MHILFLKQQDNKHQILQLLLVLLLTFLLVSCNDGEKITPEPPTAVLENIEIGSGGNGKGIIGRDFHFDMDVVAATRIENVQVMIKQQNGKTYSRDWSFELTWEEFKGVRNTNVHKHFNIPDDAPEGEYDFFIRVSDQNGSIKEEKRTVELISPEKLPVLPELYSFMLQKVGKGYVYVLNRGYMDPTDMGYAKGDTINAFVDIRNVKDDGILYTFLIKKSAGHKPESVKDIDFSKVIITDVREHKSMGQTGTFTNYVGLPAFTPQKLMIGSALDNNSPTPGAVGQGNTWVNGDYYFGIVYTNTTHNMSVHYYIDLGLSGF